uniref:Uncharacterized protein n=1 Tax=Fagus sylvatica TaxID=28930 RepID=A0A2N9J1T5_FAGSY
MHDVELSDRQDFTGSSRNPDRKTALKRTKNTPAAEPCCKLLPRQNPIGTRSCARMGQDLRKNALGENPDSRFARRVFPRNKPGCVGKITTPATTWNSRFAGSIPRLTGIFAGKVHEKTAPDDPDFREP